MTLRHIPSSNISNSSIDLSVVIPAFNEAKNIPPLIEALVASLKPMTINYEIIFVNDGSKDDTLKVLQQYSDLYPEVGYLSLSQNYGHQVALLAGLKRSQGHVVISMDSDFQHPPELLPDIYKTWQENFSDVIQTRRKTKLKGESRLKQILSLSFYKAMNLIFNCKLVESGADFRLMGPKLIEDFRKNKRDSIFLRGFCAKADYKTVIYDFNVDPRLYGKSKYTLFKQIELAILGLKEIILSPKEQTMSKIKIAHYQSSQSREKVAA